MVIQFMFHEAITSNVLHFSGISEADTDLVYCTGYCVTWRSANSCEVQNTILRMLLQTKVFMLYNVFIWIRSGTMKSLALVNIQKALLCWEGSFQMRLKKPVSSSLTVQNPIDIPTCMFMFIAKSVSTSVSEIFRRGKKMCLWIILKQLCKLVTLVKQILLGLLPKDIHLWIKETYF